MSYLFIGDPSLLPCGDATSKDPANLALLDSNGDGALDVSDAIWLLTWKFLGGPPHVLGNRCADIPDCPKVCGA
ncbi:MAG: hypothetical protein HY717_15545 [Planctomycetes bacterium]|nr:hypothetical protein [Planctomycetota bacterium]